MAKKKKKKKKINKAKTDEGGILAAFERGFRNAMNTPPEKPSRGKKKARRKQTARRKKRKKKARGKMKSAR